MPRWQHDCDRCEYLGTIFKDFDLYVCRDEGNPELDSYLIRCSDEESDYLSTHIPVKKREEVRRSIGGITDKEAEVIAVMRSTVSFFLNNLKQK